MIELSILQQKTFLRSFIKRVEVSPGIATLDYSIPLPLEENRTPSREVLCNDRSGCRAWIRTRAKGSKVPCATTTQLGNVSIVAEDTMTGKRVFRFCASLAFTGVNLTVQVPYVVTDAATSSYAKTFSRHFVA